MPSRLSFGWRAWGMKNQMLLRKTRTLPDGQERKLSADQSIFSKDEKD